MGSPASRRGREGRAEEGWGRWGEGWTRSGRVLAPPEAGVRKGPPKPLARLT